MEKLRKKNKKHSPKVPSEKKDEGKAVPYVEAPDVPRSAGKKAGTPPIGSVISVKEAEKADRVIEEEKRKSLHQEADNRGFVMEGEDKPMVQPIIARNRGSPIPGRSLTPEAQQSASPKITKRNVVEPSPGVMNEIMGSAVTLQSKEAWMDRPGTGASFGRKSSKETADALNKSLVSLRDQEDEINEHHAYVPYVYARDCVRRMVEDMKKMKKNHVRIVHDIEFNYKAIEGETQSQFNVFVMSLRTQYAQKVQTFRQVIEVHRLELQQKQQYWDEALASLSSRNKVLLLDKKSLLVQNRVEYERMEQEKNDAVSSLTRRLDDTNAKLTRIQTDMDGQFDKERQQYEMRLEQQQQDYDEEIKIIQEELNTEKAENEKLKQILEDLQNNPLAGAAVVATVAKVEKNRPKDSRVKGFKAGKKDEEDDEEIEKTEEELQKESATIKREPTVIVTDMSQDERRNWDEERNQMEAERREIMQERQELEQERGQVEEDRKKFQEDRVILQGELNNASKDAEMWKAKYDALKHELRKLGQLQAKNNALQAQFDAVLSVAVIATEEDQKRANDMINKAKDDKTVMEEQKDMLEQDAKQWTDDFKRKNMRDPTSDDHTDSMKETITSLDEANGMIDALNIKVDTLEKLKRGETPDAPVVKPLPVVIPDPEVKVVELRVPDPEVIAQLEMTQAELDALRKQVMALKNRATTLQSQQTQLKSRLAQAKAEINKLMAANQELEDQLRRAGAGAGAVAVATTAKNGVDPVEHAEMKAELEKQLRQTENDLKKELQDKQEDYEARIKQLEKEKKMMERDIKKLLKAHAKLKQKMTAKEDHYNEILPVVIQQVHEIHRLVLPASEMVGDRLREAETNQTKAKRHVEKASKEYESWELGWAEENGKEPTEADREMDSDGRLLYDEQGKSKKNMKDQDNLVVALTMMKTGLVPDLKHKQEKTVGETQSAAKDAILEEAAGTEDKIEDLENHISDLDSDNQALKAKVQRLEEKIASLEADLEEAKEKASQLGVTAAVASAGTSQEDIEALKKAKAELEELLRQKEEELQKEQQEKEESKKQCTILDAQLREMEKDIKKMIKQYNKLKEKAKSDGVTDPSKLEEKITELEEKIIDMEGDRDTLIGQNKKQEEKIDKLDQELDEAKQRLALLSGAAVGAASAEDVEALRRAKAELEALLRQTREDFDKESLAKQTLEKELQDKEDEKKEMEKDMKKMMKQYQKLKDKLKGEDGEEANIGELENKIIDLETDKESLTNKTEQQDNKITELERELEDAKAKVAELSGVAAVAVTAEDAEDLRKALTDLENQLKQKDADIQKLNQTIKDLEGKLQDKEDQRKEMEKDMKKMMRQYQKLKDQSAGKPTDKDNIEEKLSDLENKVIELEADNNSLKETKQDLNEKIKNLEAELETVAAAAPSATAAGALAGAAAASELRQEKLAHDMTKEELEALRRQIKGLKADLNNVNSDAEAKLKGATSKLQAEINNLSKALAKNKERVAELEKARIENMPVDAKKEIKAMQAKLTATEKEKDANLKEMANTEGQVQELKAKVASLEQNNKQLKQEISELQNRLRAQGRAPSARPGAGRGGDAALKVAQEKLQNLRRENQELKQRIKELEVDAKKGRVAAAAGGGDSGIDPKLLKRHEKILKELEKRLENETNKNKKNEENLQKREQDLKEANKDIRGKDDEIQKLRAELSSLGVMAKEGVEAAQKVKSMEKEVKKLAEENKTLAENFNSERVLRKKYYNIVEDMKGKIRVYCRARPMSKSENERGNHSVVKSPDEYTINVDSQRGIKEFQFDQVFMPEHSQEKVFEDTNNLIQSAVDGYNVCIFAYGQTGSGKTYTMIGDKEQTQPGIAPRAFNRLFEVMEENKSKFRFKVTSYMLELYNDKLLDLYAKPGASSDDKFDIKKDKKGLVYVQGAEIKAASNSKELFALFEEGSKNRHTASTKMNDDSSRSHLILAIIIESINKTSGQVMKGKLSLVDLAGSERAAKTQASAEQLKEAMSINKSLSALGDVISALSSEQAFIPYRNNKLTMLMQDSLGGNAKTLMFVNISPADYNTDETVISLTYASRVKLITNDASKNADNKEIARLKQIINKMKKGESVEEEGD